MKKFIVLLFLVAILLPLNFTLVFSANSDLNNISEEITEQTENVSDEITNEDEDFDISSLEEYDETNFEDGVLPEDDELFQENRMQSVILFLFCLICIIAYIIFMKKERAKEKNNSKSANTKSVTESDKANSPGNTLYLISIIFTAFLLIFCFIGSIIDKNLADVFLTIMLGALMYTLLVLIQNEKNLTNIINKSIKIHKKDGTTKKPTKSDKDFTFVAVDFLVIISSVILILVFLFVSFSQLIDWDIISAVIFVLLAIFIAMLLKFWMLIQHNNKISVNINQNKLKNIYGKSGVHLKFDNSKIKIKKKVKKSNKNRKN